MEILYVTSEAVPFAKTGGLADVCGTLPKEVARLGHRTALILPGYRAALEEAGSVEPVPVDIRVPIGNKVVAGSLVRTTLAGSDAPVYLVCNDEYFDRPGIYGDAAGDYSDNCERYVFFCRAVLEAIHGTELAPDLLHLNDWTTGLIAALTKIEYAGVPGFERLALLFTIHNLAYQGTFWHWDMLLTGLDWKYFNWHQMEAYGQLNLLKTGLVFSDAITTVSPRYAQEIQSAPLGCALEGVLQQRRDVLTGILNGCDYGQWNPQTDLHIAAQYNVDSFAEGKATCKAALQEELGLPVRADVPLLAFVGRLSEQKGLDLLGEVLKEWLQSADAQWVVLGTGDAGYHELLIDLGRRYPQKLAARIEFSDQLAHRIEAGADMFLMPSRFEPCGLSQLYSLKYGTLPVVRATGGLADTITDLTPASLAAGTANGFSFQDASPLALSETLHRACNVFTQQKEVWAQVVRTAMLQDWSWSRSAEQYVSLYADTIQRVRQGVYAR